MKTYKVKASVLNKRTHPVTDFKDNSNIVGTVLKGTEISITDEVNLPNGTWLKDTDGNYYWGGGMELLNPQPQNTNSPFSALVNVPANWSNYAKGIDLSHHNSPPDWDGLVAEGIEIAYIKITDGVGTRDAKANIHAHNAKTNGIKVGYYHFARPDKKFGGTAENDSLAEANEVLSTIKNLPVLDLPLVLDLEDTPPWDSPLGKTDYLAWVNNFIKSYNKPVILYSRKSYLDLKLDPAHGLTAPVWLSRYTFDFKRALPPAGWQQFLGWQFSEDGKVANYHPLDLSIWDRGIFAL